MFSKAFLRLCCALCVLASCVFISADAQQSTFTLTVTTTGIDSGAVQMRWTSGISGSASVCDAPVPSATCSISNIPSGATVVISSNAPGGSTPGVILSGVPQACIDTSTCTFPIGADTTVHVAFGGDEVSGVTYRTLTIALAGLGDAAVAPDNNTCQNFDPLQYGTCTTGYATGSMVTLAAFHLSGSAFVGFSGGTTPEAQTCTTSNSSCTFPLNTDSGITATFARLDSIAVSPPSATTNVGNTQNFAAVGTYSNNTRPTSFTRNLNNGDIGTWKFKALLGTARFGHAAVAFNGRLLVLGGVRNTLASEFCPPGLTSNGYCVNINESVNTTPLDSVESYDPSTNSWSPAPSLSLGTRASFAAAVAGSKVYALGGSTSGNATVATVEAFDGFSWGQVASLSSSRRLLAAGAVNGIVYAVGGMDGSNNALNIVEAYDTSNPGAGWTPRASLPTARHSLSVAVVNGILYAIGGSTTGGGQTGVVEAYDPMTNSWSAKASMFPGGRNLFGVAVVGDQIYAVGGNANGFLQSVLAYDTATNSWSSKAFLPLQLLGGGPATFSTARAELAAASINGVVYAVGGNENQPPNLTPPTSIAVPTLQAFSDSLVWSSSDVGIATITQFGSARGQSVGGPVTLTARTGTISCAATNSCGSLTVTAGGPPPQGIQIFTSPSGSTTQVGSTQPWACVPFHDPNTSSGPWTATVNFGDNPSPVTIPVTGLQGTCASAPGANGSFQLSHAYAAPGTYTVLIKVVDGAGFQGTSQLQVVVTAGECAHITATVTGNNGPFNTLDFTVFDRSTNPPTLDGMQTFQFGVNDVDVEPGSYRVVFTPSTGYVASPPQIDLDPVCGDHLAFSVQVALADTTPPVTTAVATPAPNASGWNNANVTVALNASDNTGGSGVDHITYSIAGAQSGGAAVNGAAATVVVSADGVSTITFFATDHAGNPEAPRTLTIRIDRTAPAVTASPSSGTIWPPNGKMVPIVVSGSLADTGSGIDASTAAFHVVDEYGTVQPAGAISVLPNGTYSVTVLLEARRSGGDQDGRTYQIVVSVSNNAGVTTSATTVVTVPHDQR